MKKSDLLFIMFILLFCFSCKDTDSSFNSDVVQNNPTVQRIGLAPDVTILQSSDAKIVANIFMNKSNISRNSNKAIKNVVSIPNNSGITTLYAVNFNDGFILIPASKNLAPILAIVDHGNFSLEDAKSGRDVIISQLIAESDYWQTQGGNDIYKDEWRRFTIYPSEIPIAKSSTDELDDPWNAMYGQMYEFQDRGYECYRITKFEEDQDIMPDEILQRFKRTARYEDNIWEDKYGEDFLYQTALVVIRDESLSNTRTQCLKTTWNQIYPYNSMIDYNYYLGCVTIATAQIMKYHKHPSSYNWDAMPNVLNTGGSNVLTNFLAELHDKLGVDETGGASINDAERVLKSYGYIVTKSDHKTGNFIYPTYCRGVSKDEKETVGHAWVCDGMLSSSYASIYELYLFDNSYYPKFVYSVMADESKYHYSPTLYHMNWGWGGQSDGYYNDNNMAVYDGGKTYYFNNDRKDLFIKKP